MYCITDRTWRRNDKIQERLGYNIRIITISKPTAYSDYEPYHFVRSYEEVMKNLRKKQVYFKRNP